MSKKLDNRKDLFYYNKGKYNSKNYWSPGDPLTERDLELLKIIHEIHEQIGRSPTRNDVDVQSRIRLKSRFRTWGNVLLAAGLPSVNAPEETRKRQQRKIDDLGVTK